MRYAKAFYIFLGFCVVLNLVCVVAFIITGVLWKAVFHTLLATALGVQMHYLRRLGQQ